ncbi:hypothetical protein CEXT_763671 [Caerostris extrusa]|uniref:Uncharacterized protein n=1 Tax=Caerostris extrusa TaxID=172846 RepID=A0AAV4WD18_CAEEX|nr:hypothetical protein CEXT_763671 [Caerostris extrusa]
MIDNNSRISRYPNPFKTPPSPESEWKCETLTHVNSDGNQQCSGQTEHSSYYKHGFTSVLGLEFSLKTFGIEMGTNFRSMLGSGTLPHLITSYSYRETPIYSPTKTFKNVLGRFAVRGRAKLVQSGLASL